MDQSTKYIVQNIVNAHEYLPEGTVFALAGASEKSCFIDLFYLAHVQEVVRGSEDSVVDPNDLCETDDHTEIDTVIDAWGHKTPAGMSYIKDYLKKQYDMKNVTKYTLNRKKVVHFYKEMVVYPFVNPQKGKGHDFIISYNDYVEVLHYVETHGLAHIPQDWAIFI